MADDPCSAASEKLTDLYMRYRAVLDAASPSGRTMPYRWWARPERLSGLWLPWDQMLEEYARELANMINALTDHVRRLRAWHVVVEPLSDIDKLAATHEFIDMLGTFALSTPYALKGKFAVAAGRLSHQANLAKDIGRAENFPTGNLYPHDIEPFGRGWTTFRPFMLALEPLGGKAFRQASANFRHAWTHDFSPNFVIGVSSAVTRAVEADGKVRYGLGERDAFSLNAVADILEIEREHAYRAFEGFRALVDEQLAAIIAFDEQRG